MGVLECNRYGCENIMCDRLSHKYGYICNECFDELILLGAGANIAKFMDTEKYNHTITNVDAYEFFNEEFELRK